jgi:hypothetical protein
VDDEKWLALAGGYAVPSSRLDQRIGCELRLGIQKLYADDPPIFVIVENDIRRGFRAFLPLSNWRA